jgi:hypothetical protein
VEGIPYGKKKINFNQPMPYIAADVATYFGGNLYGYEFDEIDNSMLVILTNGFKVRIQFKEQKHDEQKQGQEQEHFQRGAQSCRSAGCAQDHAPAEGSGEPG